MAEIVSKRKLRTDEAGVSEWGLGVVVWQETNVPVWDDPRNF